MLCITVSFSASSTRSSAYFTLRITCPPVRKYPNSSRASLVRYTLCKLNRIGNKQYPCVTHLPFFTLLVYPLVHTYFSALINLLSPQLVSLSFRISYSIVFEYRLINVVVLIENLKEKSAFFLGFYYKYVSSSVLTHTISCCDLLVSLCFIVS